MPGLARLAARCSRVGPLLYAEAQTYGGPGSQAVVAWRDGQVSLGPVLTQDAVEGRQAEGFVTVHGLHDRAINRGLRHLGVRIAPDNLDGVRRRVRHDRLGASHGAPVHRGLGFNRDIG